MSRTLIGYGYTNSQGIATLDHDSNDQSIEGYVGEGAGQLNIKCEYGSLQSEIYEVYDTIVYDNMTSSDTAIFVVYNDSAIITRGDTYATVTAQGTSNSTIICKPNNSYDVYDTDRDVIVEFDLITQNDIELSLRQSGTTVKAAVVARNMGVSTTEWNNIKLKYDATNQKLIPYVNDSIPSYYQTNQVSCVFTTSKGSFGIQDWQKDINLQIKNFKIYYG